MKRFCLCLWMWLLLLGTAYAEIPATLPRYRMQPMPVNVKHLQQVFGEEIVQRDTEDGRIHLLHNTTGWPMAQGTQYREGELEQLSSVQAQDFFEQTVKGLGLPVEYTVWRTLALEATEPGARSGYVMYGAAVINGIRLYYGSYAGSYVSMSYFGDDCWELNMSYLMQPVEKMEDAKLVPYEQIEAALEKRKIAATLQVVDGVELWYGMHKVGKKIIATPTWRVFGYDSKLHKGDLPTDFERYSRKLTVGGYYFGIDASTGELICNTQK